MLSIGYNAVAAMGRGMGSAFEEALSHLYDTNTVVEISIGYYWYNSPGEIGIAEVKYDDNVDFLLIWRNRAGELLYAKLATVPYDKTYGEYRECKERGWGTQKYDIHSPVDFDGMYVSEFRTGEFSGYGGVKVVDTVARLCIPLSEMDVHPIVAESEFAGFTGGDRPVPFADVTDWPRRLREFPRKVGETVTLSVYQPEVGELVRLTNATCCSCRSSYYRIVDLPIYGTGWDHKTGKTTRKEQWMRVEGVHHDGCALEQAHCSTCACNHTSPHGTGRKESVLISSRENDDSSPLRYPWRAPYLDERGVQMLEHYIMQEHEPSIYRLDQTGAG